jgi:tRNA-specific adenosine deaminase 3
MNVIRKVGDLHTGATPVSGPGATRPSHDSLAPADTGKNGHNYLLTSLTLFTTHEPCIMCSMALLHSRVKEVFYILPMARTGGCGGVACLPRLPSVNHRFTIGHWTEVENIDDLQIANDVDA